MGALHAVPIPFLDLLLRWPSPLEPQDLEGGLDSLRLQIELPDVGLDRRRRRVGLDVEPRVASADPGARVVAPEADVAVERLPPRHREGDGVSRQSLLFAPPPTNRDELPHGALRVQGPVEGLLRLRPREASPPGHPGPAAVLDLPA